MWAVPFGIVGARLYHVITDAGLYFGEGKSAVAALYVWRGGLGIWGGVALGALGVVLGARTKGIRLLPVLDAMAPGVLIGQALGRFGNWFNQELFGRPTDLPWALSVSDDTALGAGFPAGTTFHPTFLYEALWNLGAFGLVIWADRRFRLGHGRVIALYVMTYTAGRGWIEYLRIDPVELDDIAGLRLNVWVSIVCFVARRRLLRVAGTPTSGPRGRRLRRRAGAARRRRREPPLPGVRSHRLRRPPRDRRRGRRRTRPSRHGGATKAHPAPRQHRDPPGGP